MTSSGDKPIQDVKVGDYVESWDTIAHRLIKTRVSQTFIHYSEPTLWLMTSNGSITTTSVHPFLTDSGWVDAGNLVPGKSYIYDASGHRQKVLMAIAGTPQTVYNLEIDNPNHDFIANNFIVHNKLTCP